ncbi:MAG: hypothetical protein Q8P62_00250, partial [Candidatus Peregrinibacteria bacterium]|nr:hypothetical protein [Candidatus Peregrinibacteria bacterium]
FFDPKVVPGQMCFDTKNTKSNNGENISVEAYNGRAGKSNPLNLSAEVQEKLLELQQKGLDINAIILESLQKREQEIAQKKEEISKKSAPPSPSRHIPISIKRILYAEHGTKCSVKTCKKLSEQIHHVRRFSAVPSHDPHYLAPLCKAHHELAHCRDIDYLEIRKKAC